MTDADRGPHHAFEFSRRLTGPNCHFGGPAVVLTPLGALAGSATAHAAWAQRVKVLCTLLGWAAPQPLALRRGPGTVLAFAAAAEHLFTATEINEWAWERSTAAAGPLSAQGLEAVQPALNEPEAVVAHFAAMAAGESSPPLIRLKAAAAAHGLPVIEDDDTLSLGAGRGSVSYPRAALPLPMDVPWATLHSVPTVLVTGSNGKTTTARLLAAMARAAGLTPGLCSTEGIVVGDTLVERGDYAGPAGARAVLRHRAVDVAVLETARGGILRRGLAVTRADAAVVTNVSADHLGEYGIVNVEDIAEAKLVVAHAVAPTAVIAVAHPAAHSVMHPARHPAVRPAVHPATHPSAGAHQRPGGTLVLNAADAVLMAVAARTPHAVAAKQALFAREHGHPALAAHRASGGATCGVEAGRLLCVWAGATIDLGDVNAMPLTLGGAAGYNIDNAAAAVLAAAASGLPWNAIRSTLATFGAVAQDNEGRLERWPHRGATVLIDYAHNPDGLAQLLAVARALKPVRLGLLLGQAGNRSDDAIGELARAAAAARPDRIVIKELPAMLRGRAPGEVPALLTRALRDAGVHDTLIAHQNDEEAAARDLLAWAGPGDVVVLPVHASTARERLHAVLSGA